jgi:anti-sigma regulatory factor (Ser/Thr protein kinase)
VEVEVTQRVGRSTGSVAEARRWAATCAHGWGLDDIAGEVQVVVSELLANALMHACTDCTLSLRFAAPFLTVAVSDGSPDPPALRRDAQEIGGRGLQLVAAFSSTWGYEPTPQGKTVWARMHVGSA